MLPGGNVPVSNAGAPVEPEPITTPLAIVTNQVPGWPEFDPRVLATGEVTVAIQVNGRVRDEMRVPRDLPDDELKERAARHGRIPDLLEGRPIRKAIVVRNKLVSLVV